MILVANAAALRALSRVRDADELISASNIGNPMARAPPAAATIGGEFKNRRLISSCSLSILIFVDEVLLVCFGVCFIL